LPDGQIEFLGRLDQQVKIRGYRIELGEIEAVLNQHHAVREALVIAALDPRGDHQLIAYLVSDVAVDVAELRLFLQGTLPEYMIPAGFVRLEQMPLTPNGKVDRRALPPWEATRGSGKQQVAKTETELLVAQLMGAVLKVEEVGVEESFFELGGHSLLATQLVSRVREVFGVEMGLRAVFGEGTARAMSRVIEEAMREGRGSGGRGKIERVGREGMLPLSYAQQRLWFIDQLEPDKAIYNIPVAVRLNGHLNVEALAQTFTTLFARHEVLRTTFATHEGQPVQVISPPAPVSLPLEDLSGLSHDEREEEAQRLAREEAGLPFDLSQGSLLRVRLLRLAADEHVVLLTMHHIISDGWSVSILINEVAALYEAYSRGEASPLAELPIQYADYAVWQREYLQGEELERQIGYWREQLASAPTVLELPTDHPRPPVQSYRGARHHFNVNEHVVKRLKALNREEGVTAFMTLLAAFQTLLHRYTGQDELLVGADVANRNRVETEGLIGFFVNMLVMRGDMRGRPTFRELLQRVRETCLGAYAHQDVPFEKLVDELQLERDLSRNPLFQVAFVLQNVPMPELELPGLTMSALEVEATTSPFDIVLSITETGDSLIGAMLYNPDLFDHTTIERMVRHCQRVLEEMIERPEQRVGDVMLLSEAETHQLLVEWNQTATEYPRGQSIHHLFEEQAERRPNAIALAYGDEKLTYQELNERANQVAHYLRQFGVGEETLVGVCMERCLEMVVGLLGILKAGGAYLPLDPEYPLERLAWMMEDAQIALLLTMEQQLEKLPAHMGLAVALDTDRLILAQQPASNPPPVTNADNLAYVTYTSGSTGLPKGVEVTHRGVVRLVCGTNYVELDDQTCLMQLAPLSFDASTFELWGALLNGARCVLSEERRPTPQQIGAAIERHAVQTMWLTSSLYNLVIDESPGVLAKLQQLLIGGEALSPQHVRTGLEQLRQTRIINGYGPTEATTFTCCHPLTREEEPHWERSIPIGRPISNTQVYILDREMQLTPVGVVGELFAGGDGLARGYLNRPSLTAERFLPHPFSPLPGQRLYRTGDLVRLLSDGRIEFVGRVDTQVKVRGYRIELGEIEEVLKQASGVREAVAVVREEREGEKRLVAYVVMETGGERQIAQVRGEIGARLPEYMIPAAIVELEELPLTANGKINYRALPAPEALRADSSEEIVAPRTHAETLLADLWREVLGLEQVSIYDNFFEVGGDSMRSIQVVSKAQNYGFTFSIQHLFQYPTIHELAQYLSQELQDEQSQGFTAIAPFALLSEEDRRQLPEDVEDAYPLTMLQAGMIFHSEYSPEAAVYHDILSYQLRAPLDLQMIRTTMEAILRRHAVLRTGFDLTSYSEPLQLVHGEVDFPIEVGDLSHLDAAQQEEAVRLIIDDEKRHPFEWNKAPLMRMRLHRRSADAFQFTLSFHHALLDGWSLASLLTEIFQHYAFYSGMASKSVNAEPELAFREYVKLERESLATPEHRQYWRQQINGSNPTRIRRWPFKPDGSSHHPMHIQGVPISTGVAEQLKQLALQEGVPFKSVLLAAHLRVVGFLSGRRDIVTGLVSHGRPEETDGDRVLGLFLNTLPFRFNFAGGTWRDLIRQTFAAEQAILPFRRYPMAQIQQDLRERHLFETVFNFTHFHVMDSILDTSALEALSIRSFGKTNFPFLANFNLDVGSSRVNLTISGDVTEFSRAQMQAIRGYYASVLELMATAPFENYEQEIIPLLDEAEEEVAATSFWLRLFSTPPPAFNLDPQFLLT
ncbi:MAG TPA: amino acid adenylation domain-containing protein, partial [Pyrinomonadaceae bacterium]|nr:amino acid adenylation domain-containing protein [Pyrinomonadaceae bacterium]